MFNEALHYIFQYSMKYYIRFSNIQWLLLGDLFFFLSHLVDMIVSVYVWLCVYGCMCVIVGVYMVLGTQPKGSEHSKQVFYPRRSLSLKSHPDLVFFHFVLALISCHYHFRVTMNSCCFAPSKINLIFFSSSESIWHNSIRHEFKQLRGSCFQHACLVWLCTCFLKTAGQVS